MVNLGFMMINFNTFSIRIRWEATSSECSNSCGEGVKNVQYQCVQQYIKSQQSNPVDPTYCSNIRKPNNLEKCHGPCPDATWSYTDWEPVNYNRKTHCLAQLSHDNDNIFHLVSSLLFHRTLPGAQSTCALYCIPAARKPRLC